ncbi:MAG: hypothetical protein KatS3mg123_2019 [Burkholderiales bacterium]|nr:MAG: hypothetical protein KatS3mg123_2019 [Burkholderiales bacterium]
MSTQRVVKWGHSLAVRLPAAFAKTVNVTEGTSVNISIDDGRIVIEPVTEESPNLASLVERITPKNRHREPEIEGPVGREAW